jgi:hypothetical protein
MQTACLLLCCKKQVSSRACAAERRTSSYTAVVCCCRLQPDHSLRFPSDQVMLPVLSSSVLSCSCLLCLPTCSKMYAIFSVLAMAPNVSCKAQAQQMDC